MRILVVSAVAALIITKRYDMRDDDMFVCLFELIKCCVKAVYYGAWSFAVMIEWTNELECFQAVSKLAQNCNVWSVSCCCWQRWYSMRIITCHRWVVCCCRPSIWPLNRHLPLFVARLSILIGHRRQKCVAIDLHGAGKILWLKVNQINAIRPRSGQCTAKARRVVCLRSHCEGEENTQVYNLSANKLTWEPSHLTSHQHQVNSRFIRESEKRGKHQTNSQMGIPLMSACSCMSKLFRAIFPSTWSFLRWIPASFRIASMTSVIW